MTNTTDLITTPTFRAADAAGGATAITAPGKLAVTDSANVAGAIPVADLLADLAERRPLAGRTAVITGATSGIGAATARQFAAAGANVALVGRRVERLSALSTELEAYGVAVAGVRSDLAELGAGAALAAQVREAIGPVDLVVANAGVMLPAAFDTADQTDWTRMLDLNVRGLLETGQAFVDDLLAAGAEGRPADLVHIGSVGGHMVFPTYAVYCATKAAVAHLSRNLRSELGPRGVRVRTIEPGFTETELGDHVAGDSQGALADMIDTVGRISAHEIASAILWSSANPAYVNVAEMVVVPTKQG
jgi:NADP-dependent 3-hydroxy acid dehydrogenase YdfG